MLLLLSLACRDDKDPIDSAVDSEPCADCPVDADGDGAASDVDCDDADPAVHPGAAELCDGLDQDCDGQVDEGVMSTWYVDADQDGWGATPTEACEQPALSSDQDGDCDDEDALVHPGADERCDGQDEDCDGEVDEDPVDASTWYEDNDGDGFGATAVEACEAPEGTTPQDGDCDDDDAEVHPDAWDACDGEDNDCDGDVDEAANEGHVLVTAEASVLDAIDPSSGAWSTYATFTGAGSSGGARSVAVDGSEFLFVGRADKALYRVDACNGVATKVGPTGLGSVCGLTFGPNDDLYGVQDGSDTLAVYDPQTGVGTTIAGLVSDGQTLDVGACAMAWDCTNDRLYVLDAGLGRIFQISPTTGESTHSVSLGMTGSSAGLEWDAEQGLLLMSFSADLYTVDPSTGHSTLLGPTKGDDLAWFPECP